MKNRAKKNMGIIKIMAEKTDLISPSEGVRYLARYTVGRVTVAIWIPTVAEAAYRTVYLSRTVFFFNVSGLLACVGCACRTQQDGMWPCVAYFSYSHYIPTVPYFPLDHIVTSPHSHFTTLSSKT